MPYGFWSNGGGVFHGMLGCTPERFFQQDGSNVHTMAIAGTRLVGTTIALPSCKTPRSAPSTRW